VNEAFNASLCSAGLTRGLFHSLDMLCDQHEGLIERYHMEDAQLRQFFLRGDDLIRLYSPLNYIVTQPEPPPPAAGPEEVAATEEERVADVSPLYPWSRFRPDNVYRLENNFPILAGGDHHGGGGHSAPHAVLGTYSYSTRDPKWADETYRAKGLTFAAMLAMGQARLLYGDDVFGRVLPRPITVGMNVLDGQKMFLCLFQLNTLDLDGDEGVKNILWHEDPTPLYEVCDNVLARPTMEGYNGDLYEKLAALYLRGV